MMTKRVVFLAAVICVLALTGCGRAANDESDKSKQYGEHLKQVTEQNFSGEEGIESAEAAVTYDEETKQYSIKLSLKTNDKADKGEIENYKTVLEKTYAEVILVVNGEVV